MSLIRNCVLLLKSEKSGGTPDEYGALLRRNGFEVMLVNPLSFEFKNLSSLSEKLLSPDDFSGAIFSSPRCVHATSLALPRQEIQKLWGAKANFAVGEATAREALEKLGLQCDGQDSGNAKTLAQVIIQDRSKFDKPFLFPHGNLKTDTLKVELRKWNLGLQGVLVYETIANPKMEDQLKEVTSGLTCIPEYLVFFSPSGLHSSISYLRKVQIDFDLLKIIAIGPVTEMAIVDEKLKLYKTAKSPTPEEVLQAIM